MDIHFRRKIHHNCRRQNSIQYMYVQGTDSTSHKTSSKDSEAIDRVQNASIALQFGIHISISTAETPAKFQID